MSTGLVRAVNSSVVRLLALKKTLDRLAEQEKTDVNNWLIECLEAEIEDIEQELVIYYEETGSESDE
jgi:hypothetical protein